MSVKVWCAIGKPQFYGYESEKYVFKQGNVSFFSTWSRIPAIVFSKIINSLGKNDDASIRRLKNDYQVTQLAVGASSRDLFPKATISSGLYY